MAIPSGRTFKGENIVNSGKFVFVLLFGLLLSATAFGQGSWLDKESPDNWNTGKKSVPRPPAYPADELARCGHTVRPATTVADNVLTNLGWKLVGPAQVWGKTAVVQVTREFDGQCRPFGYEVLVFSENKLVGSMSPKPMDSRTDGSLFSVELYNEHELRAQYNRYKDSDPSCCASGSATVFFSVNEENGGLNLVPHNVTSTLKEEPASANLENTKWKWVEFVSPVEDTAIASPENYTLQFGENGSLSAQVDCNKGVGTYTHSGSSLTFSPLAVTRMACPEGSMDSKFLNHLQWVRIMKIEGNNLFLDLFADGGTMKFEKVTN